MKRLAQTQNDGATHVSSVVLADDEAADQLAVEEAMHRLTGWTTSWLDDVLVCTKGSTVRQLWIVDYDPMALDASSEGVLES